MSTPQSQLYTLSERIWDLYGLFKPDGGEDEPDIFERIKNIELQMAEIIAAYQRHENLMNILIKLSSKYDDTGL
jgi:hypothetical protein